VKNVDIAVVGTGPGGQRAAIQAAKLGASVVAIEHRGQVGGTAIHAGTIPSKTLREAVMYLTGFRQRGLYGVSYSVKQGITISDLMFRLDHVLRNEIAVMESQLSRNGVDVMFGAARFDEEHTLRVTRAGGEEEVVRAEHIILAPGSVPAQSPLVPVDAELIFDADSILSLDTIPRRLTIIGGGVIGMEYASIFAALGVRVTLVERRDDLLDFADREIVDALLYHMRDQGVVFRLGEEVERVEVIDGHVAAFTTSRKQIDGDRLLYTVGRMGATAELGLERIGLEPDDRGRLSVNAAYQTTVPYVYAVGDVIGFPALGSTAMEQGRLAVLHALGGDGEREGQPPLPFGIYTVPEVSMVGSSEAGLTEQRVPYEVGVGRYSETARGQIVGDTTGRLKLIVHAETREVLGVHIIGEGASELVHIGQAVIALHGTLDYLVNSVFNYPTLAETYKIAALDAYNKLYGREA
jgi:NAD(P) transhydrogenase